MKTGGGMTTVFVYDALGELAAEYSNAANTSACLTCYLSYDHLGTTRLVTNGSGQVVSRHDYLPFGEEIPSGVGGRDGTWGSGADGVNQKFTGKERDSETGLDYFGARYYGGALGRFTNPDDPSNDQDEHDPQSWNLYSGVRNNPLRNIDPNGEDCITTSNQTSSGVTVTTERGGSTTTCSGTYVNGTVDVNSFSYNGGSLGYSFANDTASGAGTIQFGQIQSDDALSPDVANALRQSGVMAFPLVNLTAQGLKFGASVAFPFTSLLGNAVVGSDSTAAKVAGVSRKPGKLGQFKGTDSLRRENKIARDIIKQLNLQGKRAEQVHDIIQGASIDAGEKLGYTELLEIVKTTLGLL
jgi:RHS repeat-associated protein